MNFFSHLALVVAHHQIKLTFSNIFEPEKVIDLESEVIFHPKLCMNTMKSNCKHKFVSLSQF